MIALIQRVTSASVKINNTVASQINHGILALIGVEKNDTEAKAENLFNRILTYRIFEDENEKMNLSVKDISGDILLVPQFTLAADTHKGTRPGFSTAMAPNDSDTLFSYLVNYAQCHYPKISSGVFGAYMQITLCNDGPVTFILK